MLENPTQGPPVTFKRRPRQVTPRFMKLMGDLRKWRSDDHEDNIVLYRSYVIELIEGVDALIEGAKPPPMTAMKDELEK